MEQESSSKLSLPEAPVAKPAPAAPRAARRVASGEVAAEPPTAAPAAEAEADAPPEEDQGPSMFHQWLRESPSWLTSLVVHMVLLLVLALWMIPNPIKETVGLLTAGPTQVEEPVQLEELVEPVEQLNVEAVSEIVPQPVTDNIQPETNFSPAQDLTQAAVHVELSNFGDMTAPKNDLLNEIGAATGSGLSGRGKAARKALVAQGGGNRASEQAVARALKWLAAHQLPDGSWAFDHRVCPTCQGKCPDGGTLGAKHRIGATAMALMPFLGAGQTHREGNYKKTVHAGLYFIVRNMKVGRAGGDCTEPGGSMYSHGLASIILCEAYGMTQDKELLLPAQATINFIVNAQDPVGGGWRYKPRQPGDTSVVGWQVMALKSAHMAYLQVPPITVKKASHFLDSVQTQGGAAYGYTDPGSGLARNAVGLLSRMYLGWKKDNPALQRGCQQIAKQGPKPGRWYYNYYANQVLFQFTSGGKGDMWKKWNVELRDHLVGTQAKEGHATGSWHIKGDHGSERGGRLYCTSMATVMLEIYYRHMPIFKEAAVEEAFPL